MQRTPDEGSSRLSSELLGLISAANCASLAPLLLQEALDDVKLLRSMGAADLVESLHAMGADRVEVAAFAAALFPEIDWDSPFDTRPTRSSSDDDDWLLVDDEKGEPSDDQAAEDSDEDDGPQLEDNPAEQAEHDVEEEDELLLEENESEDGEGPRLEENAEDTDDEFGGLRLEDNEEEHMEEDDELMLEENAEGGLQGEVGLRLEDKTLSVHGNGGGSDSDELSLEENADRSDRPHHARKNSKMKSASGGIGAGEGVNHVEAEVA